MTRWRPIVTTAACVVALGLSAFLTWGHYFDQAAITNSCSGLVHESSTGSGFISCGDVTTSAESVIFGIPVALYGLLYFVAMLALCVPRAWRSPSRWIARARLAMSVVGMGFVLYLVSVEFLEIHHLCLYCSGVHLLQFVVFLLVVSGWDDTGYAVGEYSGEEDDGYARFESASKRKLIDA